MFQVHISFLSLVGAHTTRTRNILLSLGLFDCCFCLLQKVSEWLSYTFRWRLLRAEGVIDD